MTVIAVVLIACAIAAGSALSLAGRWRLATVPGVLVAVAYWIGVGWLDDAYDLTRGGKIVITGVYALVFAGVWALFVWPVSSLRRTT